jgi:hypothetical protein
MADNEIRNGTELIFLFPGPEVSLVVTVNARVLQLTMDPLLKKRHALISLQAEEAWLTFFKA